MKLYVAALVISDIKCLMNAAGRPELSSAWQTALIKLREDGSERFGIRFRPIESDTDWCLGSAMLLDTLSSTLQAVHFSDKEEFYLIKLRGALEPLFKYPLLCKLDEFMWTRSDKITRAKMWGGFGFESSFYVGDTNPWPHIIGDVL